MLSMMLRALALTMSAAACGNVGSMAADAAAVGDRPGSDMPTTYQGHVDATMSVTFGGGPKGFCLYGITLQQLDVELAVDASGEVRSGQVRDLNVESVLPVTPPCPHMPAPPKIADYTLESAKRGPDGMILTFLGAAANRPTVTLSGTLVTTESARTATLTFRRIDQPADPVLNWVVVVTTPMAPR